MWSDLFLLRWWSSFRCSDTAALWSTGFQIFQPYFRGFFIFIFDTLLHLYIFVFFLHMTPALYFKRKGRRVSRLEELVTFHHLRRKKKVLAKWHLELSAEQRKHFGRGKLSASWSTPQYFIFLTLFLHCFAVNDGILQLWRSILSCCLSTELEDATSLPFPTTMLAM